MILRNRYIFNLTSQVWKKYLLTWMHCT